MLEDRPQGVRPESCESDAPVARGLAPPRLSAGGLHPLAGLAAGLLVFVGLLAAVEGFLAVADLLPRHRFPDPWFGATDVYPFYVVATTDGETRRMKPSPQRQQVIRGAFTLPKPEGTYRVFVVGGSTVAVGLADALGVALETRLPGQRLEVINAGIAGADSLIVGNVVAEVVKYEPDLVVVYSGHNEYPARRWYGSMRPMAPLNAVRVFLERHSRLFVAAADGVERARFGINHLLVKLGLRTRKQGPPLFTQMPGGPLLDYEREELEAAYEANLRRMAAAASEAGVPIMFCTLASNPFVWHDRSRQRAALPPVYERALAEMGFEQVERKAHDLYRQGMKLFSEGERAAGLTLLGRARDLDPYPIRAWTALNERVRLVGRETRSQVIDIAHLMRTTALLDDSATELFHDSMHPSAQGGLLVGRYIAGALALDEVAPRRWASSDGR
jgi:hypothetical protein